MGYVMLLMQMFSSAILGDSVSFGAQMELVLIRTVCGCKE